MSQARRTWLVVLALAAAGCGGKRPAPTLQSFKMGERARVGTLTYNVIEAEWKTELGEGPNARLPRHRFLLLRLSITNTGGRDVAVPLLSLQDAAGRRFLELDNGEGVRGWLGALRIVRPAQTEQGSLLFDAPLAAYQLEISDGGETGSEKLALVEIPLNMEADPRLTEPPANLRQ